MSSSSCRSLPAAAPICWRTLTRRFLRRSTDVCSREPTRRRHDARRNGHGQCAGGRLHADAGHERHHGDEPHHFQASVLEDAGAGIVGGWRSGGVGAFHHLCAELFSSLTGIKMTHVPYRGSAPSTMALISGQIDVLFVDLGPMLPQIRADKARVLGITSDRAFPTAPDIKPLAEVGLPSWPNTIAWQMLLA